MLEGVGAIRLDLWEVDNYAKTLRKGRYANEKRYCVAYSSNLSVPQMRTQCTHATILGTANLQGWELLFKGSRAGSYLTNEESPSGSIPVVIWEVALEEEQALDRCEWFPDFYCKKDIRLRYKGIRMGWCRTVTAYAYVAHKDRPIVIQTGFYMRNCLNGYGILSL